jgi:hypothetical protein
MITIYAACSHLYNDLLTIFNVPHNSFTASYECYTCENIDDPDDCHNITESGNQQVRCLPKEASG